LTTQWWKAFAQSGAIYLRDIVAREYATGY
jgi:hypothetical protein